MREVVYDRPKCHQLRTLSAPSPEAGEVVVRVTMTGICGTDVYIHHGKLGPRHPLVAGHEILGIVEEIGPVVNGVDVRDRVVYEGRELTISFGTSRRELNRPGASSVELSPATGRTAGS